MSIKPCLGVKSSHIRCTIIMEVCTEQTSSCLRFAVSFAILRLCLFFVHFSFIGRMQWFAFSAASVRVSLGMPSPCFVLLGRCGPRTTSLGRQISAQRTNSWRSGKSTSQTSMVGTGRCVSFRSLTLRGEIANPSVRQCCIPTMYAQWMSEFTGEQQYAHARSALVT